MITKRYTKEEVDAKITEIRDWFWNSNFAIIGIAINKERQTQCCIFGTICVVCAVKLMLVKIDEADIVCESEIN